MYYFDIAIASKNYRGRDYLTYSYSRKLSIGQAVIVKFNKRTVRGFVIAEATKPTFAANELEDVEKEIILPQSLVKLFRQLLKYYPSYPGALASLILPSYAKMSSTKTGKEPKNYARIQIKPSLNALQSKIINSILNNTEASSFVIHGDTGTGKTRIYQDLAHTYLQKNKSVVILTPEISLTPPIYYAFQSVFGDAALMIHSAMTPKERAGIWASTMSSDMPLIIIGPRSSLFMPINNLGLIIVDEFHDSSYKQNAAPFYNAVRAASMLAQDTRSKLILGSATPSVVDYYFAEQKNVPTFRIVDQALTGKPKELNSTIVNLSDPNEKTAHSLISNTLIKHISEQLAAKKQSLVFINRRGSSRSIVCQDCGWRALCKNCELPLVYHHDFHQLICHTCGFKQNSFNQCPDCGSVNVIFKSPGTKSIVESLQKIFPNAKIARFDKDNKKSEKLENNYQAVLDGEIDIVVGTQLLTKGHDLPKLGLAAIVQAEMSLDFPDFTSEERTFQIINQFAGRVGRGHVEGKLLVQTFDPRSKLLKSAINSKWQEFYTDQLAIRKKFGFPPYYHALKIESSRKTRVSAEKSLNDLLKRHSWVGIKILGPSPSYIEKQSQNFSWQLILMSKERSDLVKIAKNIKGNFKIDIDPINFL